MRAVYPEGVTSGVQSRAPSAELWRLAPLEAIDSGRIRGWHLWEDFINFPDLSATDANLHKWSSFGDTGSVIKQIDDQQEVGGVLQITSDGDGENAGIQTGGEAGGFVKLDASTRVWFEARFRFTSIADTKIGAVIGLHEPITQSTSVPLNGGAINDQDYVLIFHDEDDGDNLDFVANKASGTAITFEADAKTLVADTFVKVGFLWDPYQRQEEYLSWFVDGVKEVQDDYTKTGSKANTVDDTTNFPGGQTMGVIIAVEMAATGSPALEVDWVKCASVPYA